MRSANALLLGAAAVLIATLPLTAQTAPAAPSGQAGQAKAQAQAHHEMPKPTNLQVLAKDISGPDLIATMRGFTKALGVECEFCHAEDPQTQRLNIASDAKPDKKVARTMIAMTAEINAKYLSTVNDPDATPADKTVTCGTCHRGHTMPLPFVAPGAKGKHPAMAPMPAKPE
ncbi:MAG: c-type cytochrome [Silvibacterium sp.]